MTAVGDYEVVVEELGPFDPTGPNASGSIDAPLGKVFLSASHTGNGNPGLRQTWLDETGSQVHWALDPAGTVPVTMTVIAPCARLGQA